MDIIYSSIMDLADKKNFDDYRISGNELQVRGLCPICHGGDHHDRGTFSINIRTGLWNCKRGSCTGINGKNEGTLRDLCNYFGEEAPQTFKVPKETVQKKSYIKPDPEMLQPLTEEIITYCATRKISEETLKDFKVASDKDGNIVFPFYRDGVLTYVKYRKPAKFVKGNGAKEWQMSNTQPILFGMDLVTFNRPLVITEGEFDALALYEAGVTNVVSVPAGAENMDWIDPCWEWLDNFNHFILFGDSDEPGLKMISTLSKRLGEDRCMIPPEYPEFTYNGKDYNRICKDANEILMGAGPEVLKQLVDSCEPAPIKGIIDVGSVQYIDPTSIPRIQSKYPSLDNMIGGFEDGGITVLSGRRGEGRLMLSINMVNQ